VGELGERSSRRQPTPGVGQPAVHQLPTDFTQLPTVAVVIPNEQNDMHDGTIRQGDDFLKNNLDAYVQFARNHNSMLIVTFDEDGSSPRQ
jgi:Phosphoesterase family.